MTYNVLPLVMIYNVPAQLGEEEVAECLVEQNENGRPPREDYVGNIQRVKETKCPDDSSLCSNCSGGGG